MKNWCCILFLLMALGMPQIYAEELKKQYHVVLQQSKTSSNHFSKSNIIKVNALVLKRRLQYIKADSIEMMLDSDMRTIDIRFLLPTTDSTDLKMLLQTTGKVEIYETYKLKEVIHNLACADTALSLYNRQIKGDTSRQPFFKVLNTSQFVDSNNSINRPEIGYVKIKDTSKVNGILRLYVIKSCFDITDSFAWAATHENNSQNLFLYILKGTKQFPDNQIMQNDDIILARAHTSKLTGKYSLRIQLNKNAAAKWKTLTKKNIGGTLPFCIDGKVYGAPYIIEEISGGNIELYGLFAKKEARLYTNILQSHPLSAPLKIIKFEEIK